MSYTVSYREEPIPVGGCGLGRKAGRLEKREAAANAPMLGPEPTQLVAGLGDLRLEHRQPLPLASLARRRRLGQNAALPGIRDRAGWTDTA